MSFGLIGRTCQCASTSVRKLASSSLSVMRTVKSSTTSTESMYWVKRACCMVSGSSRVRWTLARTASASKRAPSWKVTSFRRKSVYTIASSLTSQRSAKEGCGSPWASSWMRGSVMWWAAPKATQPAM